MFFLRRLFFRSGTTSDRLTRFHASRRSLPRRVRRTLCAESLEHRELLSVTGIDSPIPESDSAILCVDLPAIQMPPMESSLETSEIQTSGLLDLASESLAAESYDLSQTFQLHSNPDAKYTIYLDFTGGTTTQTSWNTIFGQPTITTPTWSLDSQTDFSDTEQTWIQEIWSRVCEDYAPFNVDVTTEEPSLDRLEKSGLLDTEWGVRVLLGNSYNDWYGSGAGGVAFMDSFTWDTDTPCFIFKESGQSAKEIAESVSHEVGHTLGLSHDGKDDSEYYRGHNDWAPIMGASYSRTVTQWSCGEYAGATNTEDDLAILARGLGYRTDDHGDTRTTATSLAQSQYVCSGSGIIEQNTDVDLFWFTTTAGEVSFEIHGADVGANLDIKAEILSSSGSVLHTYAPTTSLDVSIQETLASGTYFLRISGDGNGDATTGYTNYGSLGYYCIDGELPRPGETPSTIVTTTLDVVDAYDGVISLREAILYAEAGATITFDSRTIDSGSTITLQGGVYGALMIDRSLTIDAMSLYDTKRGVPGLTLDAGLTNADAIANGGVFFVTEATSEPIILSGLTITGGSTSGYGGGIYCEATADVTLNSCAVVANTAMCGGGIYVSDGTLTLIETTLCGNTATQGGGIFSGLAQVTLYRSRLNGNEATSHGGGVYLRHGGFTLTSSEISGNAAGGDGGGIYLDGIAPITVVSATIAGNFAWRNGGGISASAGELTLTNTILAKNVALGAGNDKNIGDDVTQNIRHSPTDLGTEGSLFVAVPQITPATTGVFYDASLWNLYLNRNDSAVDSGDASLAQDPWGNPLTSDLLGSARVQGREIDLGAYEYVSDPVPTQCTAESLDEQSIRLTWSEIGMAQGYEIYRAVLGGAMERIDVCDQCTYTDTGLTEQTTYEYRVYAILPDGVSEEFACATATTQAYLWTEGMKRPTRAYTVSENAKSGTKVATLTPLIRASATRVYRYTLLEGSEYFTINDNGAISVTPGAVIDYETTQSIEITVETSVNGVRTYRDHFVIQVKDVNEAPQQIGLWTSEGVTTTAEITESESVVGILSAIDPEGTPLTYRLGGTDAKLFTVVQTSNGYELRTKSTLDYENPTDKNRDNVYEVTVTASDQGRKNATETLWITVTDRTYTPNETVSLTGTGTAWTVRQNGRNIEILNGNTVLFSEPATLFPAVTIVGGSKNDTLTWSLDATSKSTLWDSSNEVAIRFDGGAGKNTVKIVGTSGNDAFLFRSEGLGVGDSFLTLTNTQTVTVEGGSGDDHYRLESLAAATTINDSRGTDTLQTDANIDLKSRRAQNVSGKTLTIRSTLEFLERF